MKFLFMAVVLAMSGAVAGRAQGKAEPRAQAQTQAEWPKSIMSAGGTVISLYEPQVLSYSNNLVKTRSVISVQDVGTDAPVFGVIWTTDSVSADLETGLDVASEVDAAKGGSAGAAGDQLEIRSVRVDELRIPDDTGRAENSFISYEVEIYSPWAVKSISEEAVQRSLEMWRQETALARDTVGVPPIRILFATQPTALVLIDGSPQLARNERWGVDVVVNTKNVIVKGPDSNYYLYGGMRWYLAHAVMGPYSPLNSHWKPGAELRRVQNDLKKAARKDEIEIDASTRQVEHVVVRTEPAALIQSDGEPISEEVKHTSLVYIGNSNNNIFYDWNTRFYYALIGNQWYQSEVLVDSLGWFAVRRADLPVDLLLSMNGRVTTNLAIRANRVKAEKTVGKMALLDEDVPQVVKVDRSATTMIDYSGVPRFKPILGTPLKYATNTCSIVIEDHGTYYALDNGVWFIAASPIGLWRVSDVRPTGVEMIPRLYAAYRAKFVYIYQTAADFVYEGYLPGYEAGPADGCALAAAYDEDWMDVAWGYDLDFIVGWGFGWHSGYFQFDRMNRYYGYMKYEGRRPGWHAKSRGPGVKHAAGGAASGVVARGSGGTGSSGGRSVIRGYVGGSRGYVSGSRGFVSGGGNGSRGYSVGGGGGSRGYSGGGGGGGVARGGYSGGGGGGGSVHVSSGGGGGGGGGGSSGGGAHH